MSCVAVSPVSTVSHSLTYRFPFIMGLLSRGNVFSNITQTRSPGTASSNTFSPTHTRKADKAREPSDRFVSVRKRLKALEAVVGLIRNSLYDDPQSAELQEEINKLRAKFRQVHLLPVTAVMTL